MKTAIFRAGRQQKGPEKCRKFMIFDGRGPSGATVRGYRDAFMKDVKP
jgi:hypothetical protein